jgi:tetratricopeptide (TPR) repeat protein
MASFLSSSVDSIGTALTSQAAARQQLAASALSRGAAAAQAKNYSAAIVEFRRAAAYNPNDPTAYQYMGKVHSLAGDTAGAIDSYRKALGIDPQNADVKYALANTYLDARQYADAEKLLKEVASANPGNGGPPTTLGFMYMQQGRLAEADTQFTRALNLAPTNPTAEYNLGLLRNEQGRYDEAVNLFTGALGRKPTYENAYADLAHAYMRLGQADRAREQLNALTAIATNSALALAAQVRAEINTPKMLYMDSARSTFDTLAGPQTPLAQLDPALAAPGASKVFKISFGFNVDMDPNSIRNALNWTIGRANGGPGGYYNYGTDLNAANDTHVSIAPLSVSWDDASRTATVYFRVTQNDAGTGVIDPAHLVFRFTGKDASGRTIDTAGDQYDGNAVIPY